MKRIALLGLLVMILSAVALVAQGHGPTTLVNVPGVHCHAQGGDTDPQFIVWVQGGTPVSFILGAHVHFLDPTASHPITGAQHAHAADPCLDTFA